MKSLMSTIFPVIHASNLSFIPTSNRTKKGFNKLKISALVPSHLKGTRASFQLLGCSWWFSKYVVVQLIYTTAVLAFCQGVRQVFNVWQRMNKLLKIFFK